MQNTTTIEQSNRLLSLGLRPDTADMHWFSDSASTRLEFGYSTREQHTFDKSSVFSYVPAWSFAKLVELIPEEIKPKGNTYEFQLLKGSARYYRLDTNHHISYTFEQFFGEPFDAVFSMICWLLERGLINQ